MPNIDPIAPIQLTPIPVEKEASLPDTALPLVLTEEILENDRKGPTLNLQGIKKWASERPFFKKNQKGKGN